MSPVSLRCHRRVLPGYGRNLALNVENDLLAAFVVEVDFYLASLDYEQGVAGVALGYDNDIFGCLRVMA